MPLDTASVTSVMATMLPSNTIHGVMASQLAFGIGIATNLYATNGLTVTTIDVGSLGIGTGFGIGIILPTPIIFGAMMSSFASNNIKGIAAPSLASALASGFTQVLATAIINTINPTVGAGGGVVTVIPNPVSSISSFISGFSSASISGVMAVSLATAIARGFDSAIISGKGEVVIAGGPSPYPGTGVGSGKLS